jgi:hypothetical protein
LSDDWIVGAHKADSNSNKLDSGKSYVIFGKIDSTTINLPTIASGNNQIIQAIAVNIACGGD